MGLYKRGNVWWSRIERNGKVFQRTTRCRSHRDAITVEATWRMAWARGEVGILDVSKAPTLQQFTTRFHEYLSAHTGKRTAAFYVDAWKPLTEYSPLANLRLHRIDARIIAEFTQARLNGGVMPATVNGSLRTLRRALYLAKDWRMILSVPKVRLLQGERMREFVITEELLSKFTAHNTNLLRLLPFLIDTGLRISEACNLTWNTVSLEPMTGAQRGWVHVTEGKSKYSKRYVPLTARAASILKLQKADTRSQWVWSSCSGRRKLTRSWASEQFRAMRDALELPWDCVLHSCRHTFCTRLGERGADAFTIMKLAGHSSITISQRYVHPTPERLEQTIGLLEPSTKAYTASESHSVSG